MFLFLGQIFAVQLMVLFMVQVRSLLATSEHLAKLCSAQSCTQFDHPILDYDKDVSLRDYVSLRDCEDRLNEFR